MYSVQNKKLVGWDATWLGRVIPSWDAGRAIGGASIMDGPELRELQRKIICGRGAQRGCEGPPCEWTGMKRNLRLLDGLEGGRHISDRLPS